MILPYLLQGSKINLRSAKADDAAFILKLRLNPELNKYLNTTSPVLLHQEEWINKQRVTPGDYYFIIETKKGECIGTTGVYGIVGDVFNCGRWIIDKIASPYVAVESIVMTYNFAFNILNLKTTRFDVNKHNTKVVKFHLSYGSKVYKETDKDVYFEFERNGFNDMLKRYKSFHCIGFK